MVNYRRNKIAGGTYFFTVTLRNRSSNRLVGHIKLLKAAMRKVKDENPYKVIAIVVLPEHLHAIWELPAADADYAMRWRKIKSYFTKDLINQGVKLNKNKHGEYNLWQRRYWEHTIKNEQDLIKHVDYIHYNPIKHGLVKRVVDWPHSSFHRYIKEGLLSRDWAADITTASEMNFGE